MDDGSFPAGSGPLSVSVPDNACWGRSVGGERMAYLPVCLKDGRLAAVGQTRTAPHVTEGYGHGPPAIARPLFMLCCSRSSPWGAARHGGRQGDRGFFTPEVSTGLLRSCPAATGASVWAMDVASSRHVRQRWEVVATYGQGCTGRAVSQCSCGLSVSPDRGQTTRTCP